VGSFLSLFCFLIYELVLANIKLAKDILSPNRTMRPGIVRVPLDLESDGEILMYAALINLTPGSIVLDLAEDRRTLYVHIVHVESPEASRRELKQGFERRVRRLFE
jgi:multicomponent Na+:H+ antiporter subunit E